MHSLGTARAIETVALPAIPDEDVAGRSTASLLITAPTRLVVETLARRIHQAGARAQFPFIHVAARDLPVQPRALREYCDSLLEAAAGGTVLIKDVEEMPVAVQAALMDLLAVLESARLPSSAVRVISGTTVSLVDRVAAGRFSDRMFYQLNVIHLMIGNAQPDVATA